MGTHDRCSLPLCLFRSYRYPLPKPNFRGDRIEPFEKEHYHVKYSGPLNTLAPQMEHSVELPTEKYNGAYELVPSSRLRISH